MWYSLTLRWCYGYTPPHWAFSLFFLIIFYYCSLRPTYNVPCWIILTSELLNLWLSSQAPVLCHSCMIQRKEYCLHEMLLANYWFCLLLMFSIFSWAKVNNNRIFPAELNGRLHSLNGIWIWKCKKRLLICFPATQSQIITQKVY